MDNQTISILTVLGITVFVIGLLILLFYMPSRQDSYNDEHTEMAEESDSETNTRITHEKKSSSSQKTIYAFGAKNDIQRCPFCDGENAIETKVCEICRREL
jgi:hypothetical protein